MSDMEEFDIQPTGWGAASFAASVGLALREMRQLTHQQLAGQSGGSHPADVFQTLLNLKVDDFVSGNSLLRQHAAPSYIDQATVTRLRLVMNEVANDGPLDFLMQ